jgi:hypothetical protein
MVYRVVSTKLSEEEHSALLDECGTLGLTPSTFVRNAIVEALKKQEPSFPADKVNEEKRVTAQTEADKLNDIIRKFIRAAQA